jgi:hypothetical protein
MNSILRAVIYKDNHGCIATTKNSLTDPRTKHIDVKYNYTREIVEQGSIAVQYRPTAHMIADALTKPLGASKFLWCRENMGIQDVSSFCNPNTFRGCVLEVEAVVTTKTLRCLNKCVI